MQEKSEKEIKGQIEDHQSKKTRAKWGRYPVHVGFRLTQRQYDLLEAVKSSEESVGTCARRMLLHCLDMLQESLGVEKSEA